jgi:hypothetical protein
MAFCGNCGAQMEATERFCVKCGKDNSVSAGAVPVVAAPAAAAPFPPAPPVPPAPAPFAAQPGPYTGPPVAIPVPGAPAKKNGTIGIIIVLVILAAGGYYYYHRPPQPQPAPQPSPSPQPSPGPQPPPGPSNSDLAKQQDFTYGQPYTSNGYLEIPGGKWVNNSNVALASATLECDQKDTNGNPLAQMRATLTGPNGPVQPGGTVTFNTIQMGSVATYVNKVNCVIVHVKQ